ncbi:Serine/threonine-protein kinase Nek6 [Polyplax serrata]|uniref:non-specific serine/threonine protein kinase n=1 Tax=Polyplax serrata TaxID=468196 RepID=A0ABR1AHA7_POLSC
MSDDNLLDCMKEIRLLQELDHPNIIKYIDSFGDLCELNIVLELADGGDLAGLLNYAKQEKLLIDEKTIWKLFVQITLALQHMHTKRIMHRDIKPANIFLTKTGTVKLGDLGLGRYFSCDTNAAHSLVGTPYYMSPERIKESGYNFKSDIWSVGCLLYELAALQSPFYGEKMTFYTLCRKIELGDYSPVPCDLYSKQLQDLVNACLRLESASRPDAAFVHKMAKKMNDHFQSCNGSIVFKDRATTSDC